MSDWLYDNFPYVMFIGCVGILSLSIYVCKIDADNWEKYKAENHCVINGTIDATTAIGITYDGKMTTTFIPKKTIYKCDGNIIKIR